MTDKLTEKLVSRAIALDREIEEKTIELKDLKGKLLALAQADEEGQLRTENGGWSWTATDSVGNIARVTTPAPTLKSSIPFGGELAEKIFKFVPTRVFSKLFVQAPSYKLVPEFRASALAELPRADATKLIKLVTTKSSPQVAFETKEAA